MVEILKNKDVAERFAQLHASSHPQAQFLWSIFRDAFHYCAVHLAEIADNARDLDFAIRWGFGWDAGAVRDLAGRGLAARWPSGSPRTSRPGKAWPTRRCRPGRWKRAAPACTARRARSRPRPTATSRAPRCRSTAASRFPTACWARPVKYGETMFETDGVRCWHTGDDIAIVSFKSRMHAIGDDVLDGVQQALDEAERNYMGLVIWQTEPPFSVGANLKKTPAGGARPSKPSALGKLFR